MYKYTIHTYIGYVHRYGDAVLLSSEKRKNCKIAKAVIAMET